MKQSRPGIVVVGGGHAGVEAALAAARIGVQVTLVSQRRREIARMSCNPSIGGTAKGQLVREIDALGGAMAVTIDATGIQFRRLNTGKGAAVQASRAQADRQAYLTRMLETIEQQPSLRIVEDEPNIRELLATSLQFAGFEVVTAGDGHEAITAAAHHDPDLVVLDVMLPDMDGFEVTRKLRERGKRAPIVFVTARDSVDDKIKGPVSYTHLTLPTSDLV